MKSFLSRIAIALVIFAFSGISAFAKRDTVTFPSNIKVNGTLVKRGTYDIKFNEETKELSILKAGKVIAHATARAEKEAAKAKGIKYSSIVSGDELQLLSVTFGGSDEKLVIVGGEAASK